MRRLLKKIRHFIVKPKVIKRDRLIVMDESDRCRNPFFLIGPHRSGSTILRLVVDSHPNIVCPPESMFFSEIPLLLDGRLFKEGLESFGFDDTARDKAMAKFVGDFFEIYRQSKGKPRWADKTPSYGLLLPLIERLFGPEASYVMIYRHPFDVAASLNRLGWDFYDYDSDPFKNSLLYVKDHYQKQGEFSQSHPDRCFDMVYERWMAQPESHLKQLFSFLNEPWDESVLAFGEQKHEHGVGDPGAQVSKKFKPSIGNWREWSSEQLSVAESVFGETLSQLGYTSDPDQPLIS